MCQSVFRNKPDAQVRFSLINRAQDVPLAKLIDEGELRVHLRVEASRLTPLDELPTAWRNSYFISSLKTVGASVFGYVATDADADEDPS